MNFSSYEKSGLVKRQPAHFKQIELQITRAHKDLLTFALIVDKDAEWAATIAYQAMLRAGRALLFSHGYLPADGRQHKTVVEITGMILGNEYSLIIKQFDKLRK
jgi:uncharacterized protein (UPF0332 family)